MSGMRDALRDYLAMRRALGFKLVSDGTALLSFVAFMDRAQADYISTAIALAWAQTPTSVQPGRWAARLGYVRAFARYCSAIDPRTEIPPVSVLPFEYQRRAPYLFADKDIEALLLGALAMPAKDEIVNHTYHCLLGLLSVTGPRISEAVNLTLDDVDLVGGILTILSSKFGKSRMIPLHSSTVTALADYRERRGRFLAGRQIPHWFVNRRGTKVRCDTCDGMFRRLADRLGLVGEKGQRHPRLHDLIPSGADNNSLASSAKAWDSRLLSMWRDVSRGWSAFADHDRDGSSFAALGISSGNGEIEPARI